MSYSNRDGATDGQSTSNTLLEQRLTRRERQLSQLVDEVMTLRGRVRAAGREVRKWKAYARCMEGCLLSLLRLQLCNAPRVHTPGNPCSHDTVQTSNSFGAAVGDQVSEGKWTHRQHRGRAPVPCCVRSAHTEAAWRDETWDKHARDNVEGTRRQMHDVRGEAQHVLSKLLLMPRKRIRSTTRACAAELLSTMSHTSVPAETGVCTTGNQRSYDTKRGSNVTRCGPDDASWSHYPVSSRAWRPARRGATQQRMPSTSSPESVHLSAQDCFATHTPQPPSHDSSHRTEQPRSISTDMLTQSELARSVSDTTYTLPDTTPSGRGYGAPSSLARTFALHDDPHKDSIRSIHSHCSDETTRQSDILCLRAAELTASIQRRHGASRGALLPPPPSPKETTSAPSAWCAADVELCSPRRSAPVPTPTRDYFVH